MKFIHRFAYFLIGLVIGSIFVYFIWNKKDVQFDYFPNSRVLKNIKNDIRVFDSKALAQMIEIGIDTADISDILEYGDVDFKNSLPRQKPCKKYLIQGEPKEKKVLITIKKCDSVSTINNVKLINNEN
jgi:hypothetical protein|tara:strand:- start:22808 stop:23191 length:384 start_codon:yes stop_codon:yes gene_type:complete